MKRLRIVVLAFALTLWSAQPARAEPDFDAVLAKYAQAWLNHDVVLLSSVLAPGAFADRQLNSLRNAEAIVFSTFTAKSQTLDSAPLRSPRLSGMYEGSEAVALTAEIRSTIARFDSLPFVEGALFTFVRKGGEWLIASDSDFADLGAAPLAQLWDAKPVTSAESSHFLFLGHADQLKRLKSLATLTETAYTRVTAFWPTPSDLKFVVIVPSTLDEVANLLNDTADVSKFVAFALTTYEPSDEFKPSATRIYVNTESFKQYDRSQQIDILAHELVHAVTRLVSGPSVPLWVEEGFANFGAEDDPQRTRSNAPAFPGDELFQTGDISSIVDSYDAGTRAFEVLARTKGQNAVRRFFELIGAHRNEAGTPDIAAAEAARDIGWSLEDWAKAIG